jgi:aerobic carbon-monoxide dehydrogenase large subunit
VSVLGNRVVRREDPRFLRGEGTYVENHDVAGALHITFVRSLFAHARITVDASEARELPGVHVFTGDDVDLPPFGPPPFPGLNPAMSRLAVARDVVRFVGDIAAIVVADSRAASVDAAELVFVDYDPLPAVVTPQDAVKDEVLLFPEAGTNLAARAGSPEHDDDLFAGCDVVVSDTLYSQRMAPCPLEPRSTIVAPGEDGRFTAWLTTQAPQLDSGIITGMLGLEPGQVRVISPDVGGGFGAKMLSVEELLVAWTAKRLGHAVRWTESRSESMVALHHGRAQHIEFTLGGTSDGQLLAYRIDMLQDSGAYPVLGAFLPNLTASMASGVYAIPRIEADGRSVVTNTTPITSFRGAGRPEASQAIERAVDLFAAKAGLDPVEVRRRNLIPSESFPYTTASGATYDSGNYEAALDLAFGAIDVAELRAEQARRRADGSPLQLGLGVSAYIEITNVVAETEFGEVEITAEGGAIIRTGSMSTGQGHETTFAQIVSSRLGIPIESIEFVKGDTDLVPMGTGTYGSKSTQIGGSAARIAADEVVERAKKLAADQLEVSPDDVVLDVGGGRFQVVGAPQRGVTWAEVAARANDDGALGELTVAHEFQGGPTFPFGSHAAVVEVDVETGRVELLRLVAVDDAGTIVNPLVFEGQVHGGVATGVAQALYEEFRYDADGTPLTTTFVAYAFPSAADLPGWETLELETPTPMNPLGAKGIGESGTMGSTPAVQSAVLDALAPYGVTHVDLPVNGENVWRALEEAKA